MIVALYILLALFAVGFILWLHERHCRKNSLNPSETIKLSEPSPAQSDAAAGGECCGMHITCEKDSLLAAVSDRIEYFDDEELDIYRGRAPQDYTAAEAEQFRDALLTLLPDDIAPWARSLQLRGIELPSDVRDELLMIVAEARAGREAATVSSDAPTF